MTRQVGSKGHSCRKQSRHCSVRLQDRVSKVQPWLQLSFENKTEFKKKCTCDYTPLKTDIYLGSEVPTCGFTMAQLTVLFGVSTASRYGHIQLARLSNCASSFKGSKATSQENGPGLWSQAPLPSTTAPQGCLWPLLSVLQPTHFKTQTLLHLRMSPCFPILRQQRLLPINDLQAEICLASFLLRALLVLHTQLLAGSLASLA